MVDAINEGTSRIVRAAFFDENDAPVTPSSARYRIEDDKSGTAILVPTSLSALSTTKDIEITAAQNAILEPKNAVEPRTLTIDFVYSGGKRGVFEYKYDVKNLRFAPVG